MVLVEVAKRNYTYKISCFFIYFQVKYLSDLGNTGEIGSWLFRVGARNEPEAAIKEPDQLLGRSITNDEPTSCNDGGRLRCHTSAVCEDNSNVGFCCRCKQGYYGNGFNCIKNDIPLRVTGKVTGNINNVEINGQLQSYVVLTDGRSYTAISPLSADVGFNAQLIAAVGYGIGWLFAKSNGNVLTPNGYEVFDHDIAEISWFFCFFLTQFLIICTDHRWKTESHNHIDFPSYKRSISDRTTISKSECLRSIGCGC